MKFIMEKLAISCITLATIQALTSVAHAAPPQANLAVSFQSSSPVKVYLTNTYSVQVANIGNRDASGVVLKIQLPKTANSPVAKIMGTLSSFDQRCSLAGTVLTCQLGGLLRNRSTVVSLNLSLAHAESILKLDASVTSQSTDSSMANNLASMKPTLTYDNVVMGDAIVNNQHCTGSQTLSSFIECIYSPSSISEHNVTFRVNGTIETEDPNVVGQWSQNSSEGSQELYFEYVENAVVIAYFNGKAVDANCFEGVTRFPLSPNYVSPYRVCIQR